MEIADSDQIKLLSIFERGVAVSSERLSVVSGAAWKTHVVSIDVGIGERFLAILARDKREYLGVAFSNVGEKYLVLFSEESGRVLVDKSFPVRDGAWMPSDMERSTLAEITDVLINGLSGTVADHLGMCRVLSSPTMEWGRKDFLYNRSFGVFSVDEPMVNVLVHLSSPDLAADCTVVLRLDELNAGFLLDRMPAAVPA